MFNKTILNFALSFIATIAVSGQNAGVSSSGEKVYVDRNGNLRGKTIKQNLKRFHYDDGGAFLCDSILNRLTKGKSDACDHMKLRDFIWNYWGNKKRGFVRITYYGVDAGVVYFLYIQPDSRGEWGIDLWIHPYQALPGAPRRPIEFQRILAVERLNNAKAGEWFVVLKNKDGESKMRIPKEL